MSEIEEVKLKIKATEYLLGGSPSTVDCTEFQSKLGIYGAMNVAQLQNLLSQLQNLLSQLQEKENLLLRASSHGNILVFVVFPSPFPHLI